MRALSRLRTSRAEPPTILVPHPPTRAAKCHLKATEDAASFLSLCGKWEFQPAVFQSSLPRTTKKARHKVPGLSHFSNLSHPSAINHAHADPLPMRIKL